VKSMRNEYVLNG